ncbi:hypothetical protein CI109_106732 [Kwoniella shandongensis]|uniref:Uncharacterized protein n=1 Tax=Kwoniella shandongensis TaxID=1734106 RepID=A0A5M6CAN6_9TREE|nr:uncharacterized protein CI109_001012 [Kwoniella shandongensis]KAA5530832.1 hypothetical protein CI109_001012 [Kwoniella shandongensis]
MSPSPQNQEDLPASSTSTVPTINPPTRPTPGTTPNNSSESVPSHKRIFRPQSVQLPPVPKYNNHGHVHGSSHASGSGSKPVSPSYNPASRRITTPTSEKTSSHSPIMSPSMSNGPLSPSANPNASSFVFPIRSVFQGMAQSDSQNSLMSDAAGSGLHRTTSRSSGHHPPRSPSQQESRHFSHVSSDDAGINTIAQMLEDDHNAAPKPDKTGKSQPGVATFSGKTDRVASGTKGATGATPPTPAKPVVPIADLSSPYGGGSSDGTAAGGSRRASAEDGVDTPKLDQTTTKVDRPEISKKDSDNTVKNAELSGGNVTNASAVGPGSGLPQTNRAPVGQPQTEPTSVNFRDYPQEGPRAARVPADGRQFSSSTVRQRQPSTSHQPELRQPKPQTAAAGALDGLVTRSRSSAHSDSKPNLELDEDGVQSLINDFSGIVRLGEAGSFEGTGTRDGSNRSTREKQSESSNSQFSGSGGPNGPTTAARLAQQQRTQKVGNARDTVRDFIEEQSHTVNLSDPNEPTPSPTPKDEDDEAEKPADLSALGPDAGLRISTQAPKSESVADQPPAEDVRAPTPASATSSHAIVSDDGKDGSTKPDDDLEEPIVTFRFEHVATSDGHHVIAGREGQLKRCEDEPITTPGAVQGFGVLMVLEEDYDTGDLIVRQVSENATELLGLSPRYLFRLDCFSRILTNEQEDILRDNLEYLPAAEEGKGASLEEEGPSVFLLSGYGEPGSDDSEDDDKDSSVSGSAGGGGGGRRREWTCWVAAHRPKQKAWDKVDAHGHPVPLPDLIVLEFELERDEYNPLMQTFETPDFPTDGTDTPESGSQTAMSAGEQTASTVSGGGSFESSNTTVNSTPRGAHRGSNSSAVTSTDLAIRPGSSNPSSSLKLPPGSKPMGLEGLDVEIPLERILKSTTNHAKPLRALERMRRTGFNDSSSESSRGRGGRGGSRGARRPARRQPAGTTGTMDVFAVLGQINDQLGSAPDLETFLKIAVGVVQDLCRFHRVLIYQFDETMNGQVVSELVEWGKTTDLFMGLMFPAADIPAQARELYKINKVRLLYDRSQTTARLVLRSKEDLDRPLDMTHCYLRAMSPIHIKYLANMHVRSSMSVSIMAFGQLWGLIACHSYGHHGMRVSFPVRQMLRILSDSISRNIERLSYAQRLHTRKLISTIPSQSHPTGYIVSNADDLLQIFDAESGLLVIGDGCKLLGQNEQGQAMLSIAEYLRVMRFDNLKASNCIQRDFPDLVLPRANDTIAGLLYVPLTAKAGQDFIVFLRKGQTREVQWAGKPYKDEQTGGTASLEPRKSFKTWSELVTGRSRAWTDDQLESAGVLALIYGKFIQVWREKQSAMASNSLTAILLSNTSHAVRTPLSQIINTLELALSGNIDSDVRSMLENSHQASRALLFHVHDLLDLTRIETGNEQSFNDPFDIRQSISDAVRLYQTESARRGLDFRVNMADNLPQYVIGDSRKIKTVISNLVANSVKFTESGFIEVYCGVQQSSDESVSSTTQEIAKLGHAPIEIVISDSGCGIATDKLEAMFVTLEGAEEAKTKNTGLGLGLAVVARIVEQLEGQLRAESEVGVGSRFYFTLPMMVHHGRPTSRSSKDSTPGNGLVRARTASSGSNSMVSLVSNHSGMSEIDSFVNEFGGSHMFAPVASDDKRITDAEERMNKPGTFPVTDSSWPVRPSRIDGDTEQSTTGSSPSPIAGRSPDTRSAPRFITRQSHRDHPQLTMSPGAMSASNKMIQQASSPSLQPSGHARHGSTSSQRHKPEAPPKRSKVGPTGKTTMKVMVVEDDMINSQILQKRLKMDKHTVVAVTNGQEAVDALEADWDYDVILMDIQMPIMDGRTAAKEIRKLEAKLDPQPDIEPFRVDGRIPIFAVSASLYESDRSNLAEDFDGWLLKPLDFARVRVLFAGLEDPAKRSAEVYVQGQWEKGGYLKDVASPMPSPSLE